MTFYSYNFFLFLPFVYFVFYLTKEQWRWLVLLSASYCFYLSFKAPQLLLALVAVTVVSYVGGICLGRTTKECSRKLFFWMGTASCILILAFIKYMPLFLDSFTASPLPANLLLTIGVSYFSFQAISYLADIYLEIQEPEQHFGYYALYLAYFPKLLQGPIERGGDLLPQLKRPYGLDGEAFCSGLQLFTWGLFKKLLVADRLALYVDPVYSNVHAYTGLPLILATYAYALQLYFDFSGYTDMARGTARVFGINLTENFNNPYLAVSIADFWRRWHISFSRWILDYIFKPLQMSWRDYGQTGTAMALLITFLVSGVWHGTSWGFLVWGLLHGSYLSASTYYRPYQNKLYKRLGIGKSKWLKYWQMFITFNLVCFSYIFFRSRSIYDALHIVTNLFNVTHESVNNYLMLYDLSVFALLMSVLLLCCLGVSVRKKLAQNAEHYRILQNSTAVHFSSVALLAVLVYIAIFHGHDSKSFIYFQF